MVQAHHTRTASGAPRARAGWLMWGRDGPVPAIAVVATSVHLALVLVEPKTSGPSDGRRGGGHVLCGVVRVGERDTRLSKTSTSGQAMGNNTEGRALKRPLAEGPMVDA